jgi:hypothetical protein
MAARRAACAAVATLLVLAACGGTRREPGAGAQTSPRPSPGDAPAATGGTTPREEFLAFARQLRAGSNMFLGDAPIAGLRAALDRTDLDPGSRYLALMNMARFDVREGRTAEGIARIEEAGALLQSLASGMPAGAETALADYHEARAIAHARHAENQNCVLRHGTDSCILPFRGQAVHVVQEPGREALKSWAEVLRRRSDLQALWLINVVAMTLGEHPRALPPQARLDFDRYQSDPGLGEFVDVAPALGLATFSLAGGVAVEDFDGDGLLDIVTSTSDPEDHLRFHRSNGDGTFTPREREAGLRDQLGGLNLISTDHDNDGDVDLLVLRGGWLAQEGCIRNSLLENDGHGVFEDVTREVGLAEPAYPTQAGAWADFDDDGDLDLYVGNEVRTNPDGTAVAYPSQLFRNDGGRFVDVAPAAGVTNDRQAKGLSVGDHDNDGDLDLYVSNIGPNRLYRNEGGMRFVDVAEAAGVTEPAGRSFVPWFFDVDEDGWLDLWVPAYDASPADLAADLLGQPLQCHLPRLYRNNRDGTFTDVAQVMGLHHPYRPMGASFGDLDNDGWLDMYLGTGDPELTSLMPNVALWNDRGRRFLDVTHATRLGHLQKGHGVGFADLDGDGDQDVFHQLGGFLRGDRFHDALFVNPGHGGHHLHVSLVGVRSNRPGVGVRLEVEVETPAGLRVIHRASGSVSSFGGSPLSRQEIGLGDATRIRELRAVWPSSGTRQAFRDVPLDAHVELREDATALRTLPRRTFRLGGR